MKLIHLEHIILLLKLVNAMLNILIVLIILHANNAIILGSIFKFIFFFSLTCDGSLETNCLSCDELTTFRTYNSSTKTCNCNVKYFNSNNNSVC